MIEPRRRSWPDISSCNSTTNNNVTTPINAPTPNTRDSIDTCTPWSLNIPSSPSPNCSTFTPSSPSPTNISLFPISSTPKSLPRSSPHHVTTRSHRSSPSEDQEHVEEEEEDFQSFFKTDSQDVNAQRLSYSTDYKSVYDAGLLPLQIPEEVEEEEEVGENAKNGVSSSSKKEDGMSKRRSSKTEETVRWRGCKEEETVRRRSSKEEETMKWPPVDAHQALINKPKPYGAFLEEIKRREFKEKVDAWKEEQTLKLMDKLQRKEDAIHIWELKQTRTATMRMKKIECKWERKRAKALKQLQKKIDHVQMEAEAKKVIERRSTVDELSRVSIAAEKMKATRSRSHLKFFCCIF